MSDSRRSGTRIYKLQRENIAADTFLHLILNLKTMKLLSYEELLPLQKIAPQGQTLFTLKRYFKPIQRIPYRRRLQMALDLMGNKKYEQILDIGFGSGIFIPELAARCEKLTATEVHDYIPTIQQIIDRKGIQANLQKADIAQMPFADNSFDCILCLSVFEFVPDMAKAISEMKRVAKPGAKIIIGAPTLNLITKLCYKSIKCTNHKDDHRRIIAETQKQLQIKKIKRLPAFLPLNLGLFFVLEARK